MPNENPSDRSACHRRRWLWLGAVGVLVLSTAGGLSLRGDSAARAAQSPPAGAPVSAGGGPAVAVQAVAVRAVERLGFERSLLTSGSLTAWDELPIGTELTGLRVVEVMAEEGDQVSAGQVLVRLNDTLLRAQIDQNAAQQARSRAGIGQSEAAIAEAEANLKDAQANLRRARELRRTDAVSVQSAETRATAVLVAEARLATAHQAVAVARADLVLVQAQGEELARRRRQTEIRAPADGVITQRMARTGQVPQGTNTDLFHLIRDGRVEMVAEVPDLDLAKVMPGQTVRVTPAAEGSPSIQGTVERIAPIVNPATRLGKVHVRLPAEVLVRPGQFARAEIVIGRVETLAVPEAAVMINDGMARVYVLTDPAQAVGTRGKLTARTVTLGGRRDGMVEVLNGLNARDRVVVSGAGFVKDGDLVAVLPPLAETSLAK
ncbi:HlyD family secretion protein [uncultured Gammaproteobacteria bacterium]